MLLIGIFFLILLYYYLGFIFLNPVEISSYSACSWSLAHKAWTCPDSERDSGTAWSHEVRRSRAAKTTTPQTHWWLNQWGCGVSLKVVNGFISAITAGARQRDIKNTFKDCAKPQIKAKWLTCSCVKKENMHNFTSTYIYIMIYTKQVHVDFFPLFEIVKDSNYVIIRLFFQIQNIIYNTATYCNFQFIKPLLLCTNNNQYHVL